MCPHCHKDAPIVHRGVEAFCTACGKPRFPLANAASVTLAGKPSKLGGRVARVFGWTVLVVGSALALGVGAIVQAIFDESYAGYIVGGAMELVSVAFSWALLGAGKSLVNVGESKQRSTEAQAAFALATHRGGIVTARDLAQSINVSVDEADRMLTELAKTQHDDVSLEVNDDGAIYYRWKRLAPPPEPSAPRVAVRVENVEEEGEPPLSRPRVQRNER